MKITRDNYEIWFLDYLEERLEPEQREMVRLFLIEHPDLAEELETFAPALTFDPELIYPEKELLRKSAFDDSVYLENQLIAAMEGDLEETDRLQLEHWLANKPAQQELAQRQYKCRLQPDLGIVFPKKERLKKRGALTGYFTRIAAVAAVLLLALLIFYPNENGKEPVMATAADSSDKQLIERQPEIAVVAGNPNVNVALKAVPAAKNIISLANKNFQEQDAAGHVPQTERQDLALPPMIPKMAEASMLMPLSGELAPLKGRDQSLLANIEMPISDYLKGRAQELKALDDHELLSRNKVVIAGLNFIAKLTGKNLTGKKGGDGRLRTISFNTQLLAVSIPINRSM